MRCIIGIFLSILILTFHFRDLGVFISFKARQDYISKTLCREREKPVNSCHGSCVLKDQIRQNHESDEDPGSPLLPPELSQNTIPFICESEGLTLLQTAKGVKFKLYYLAPSSEKHIPGVFRPPGA
jgi:hypothetical protein